MNNVNVKINDQIKIYRYDTLIKAIADEYASDYKHEIVAAFKNGKVIELNRYIRSDCTLEFITADTFIGHSIYVRGLSMMLLKAFNKLYGTNDNSVKAFIESTIGNGYYCEVKGIEVTDEMIEKISELMNEYIKRDIVYEKHTLSTEEAVSLFARLGMTKKEKLFRYRRASSVNIYELDGYIDYYYGAMPYSTSQVKTFRLERYGDGFVLIVPEKDDPDSINEFKGSPKFYSVIKESNDWGSALGIETVGELNDLITKGGINDLILIQEAHQEKRIGDIAHMIKDRKGMKFVMIAGPSSSGKTTFSHRLAIQLKTLGLKPHPIGLDDYFVNREETPIKPDGSLDYECIEAIDIELFNSQMTRLLAGERVEIPTFNFLLGKKEYKGNYKQLGPDDILVIEGIHGLNDKLSYSLPADSKFKVYISALTQLNIDEHNRIPTTDGRLIRRIVRDAGKRGADARKTISMWHSVRSGETVNIFPFQESADAMFNSALIYELAILKQYAEPLLFNVPADSPEYPEAKRLLKFLDYFLGVSSENIPYNSILREFIGNSVFPV